MADTRYESLAGLREQINDNCRFFTPGFDRILVVVTHETIGRYRALAVANYGCRSDVLLSSDSFDAMVKALEHLLTKSAEAVEQNISRTGSGRHLSTIVHGRADDNDGSSSGSDSAWLDELDEHGLAKSGLSVSSEVESAYESTSEDDHRAGRSRAQVPTRSVSKQAKKAIDWLNGGDQPRRHAHSNSVRRHRSSPPRAAPPTHGSNVGGSGFHPVVSFPGPPVPAANTWSHVSHPQKEGPGGPQAQSNGERSSGCGIFPVENRTCSFVLQRAPPSPKKPSVKATSDYSWGYPWVNVSPKKPPVEATNQGGAYALLNMQASMSPADHSPTQQKPPVEATKQGGAYALLNMQASMSPADHSPTQQKPPVEATNQGGAYALLNMQASMSPADHSPTQQKPPVEATKQGGAYEPRWNMQASMSQVQMRWPPLGSSPNSPATVPSSNPQALSSTSSTRTLRISSNKVPEHNLVLSGGGAARCFTLPTRTTQQPSQHLLPAQQIPAAINYHVLILGPNGRKQMIQAHTPPMLGDVRSAAMRYVSEHPATFALSVAAGLEIPPCTAVVTRVVFFVGRREESYDLAGCAEDLTRLCESMAAAAAAAAAADGGDSHNAVSVAGWPMFEVTVSRTQAAAGDAIVED